MNPWEKEGLTPEERADALNARLSTPYDGGELVAIEQAIRAAVRDRDAAADKQLWDAVASRDEALRLAYIGDGRSPGQTWQARCLELRKELDEVRSRAREAEARVAELEGALRPEVQRFAEAMERKLRKHDATRGATGWNGDAPADLLRRVDQELDELHAAALSSPVNRVAVLSEAADVANMAMMVADVCGGLAMEEAPDA